MKVAPASRRLSCGRLARTITSLTECSTRSATSFTAQELRPRPQERALAIFQALGEAEAKIHNTDAEKIHFHEVGAVDAIVDIVCAAVGSLALGVDQWVCSPLNVGGGSVECAHGRFPVPSPATVELLRGAPVYSSGVDAELVTPTGAAIVKTLCQRFVPFPAMKIAATGYGAGSRDFTGQPNVVRFDHRGSRRDAACCVSRHTRGHDRRA